MDYVRTGQQRQIPTATLRGLKTFYVLFFLHLESRRICVAGATRHPDQEWMEQMARNVTMEGSGFLAHCDTCCTTGTVSIVRRFAK